jgi:thiol:disulfide interchange protein DsbA
MSKISNRSLVLIAALLMPWASPSFAAGLDLGAGAGTVPQFQPYRRVHLQGLDHTVIEAMVYECPYCRALNSQMLNWAQTLPSSIHFEQMPAAIGKAWLPMTQAYFAVAGYNPTLLPQFDDAAFHLVQDEHQPYWSRATYRVAAEDVGVPASVYAVGVTLDPVINMVVKDAKIMAKAKIRKTPSLIICGRYVINPGDVQGNYSYFFELANALVSRCMAHDHIEESVP